MTTTTNSRNRGAARRALLVILALAALGAAGGAYWYYGHGRDPEVASAGERYTCGMHPFVLSDKPGKCPICGMQLTKIEAAPSGAAPQAPAGEADDFFADLERPGERKILFYRNPMDPMVTSPVPRKDEMGMEYVPVYSDELEPPPSAAAGLVTVRVGEESLRVAAVRTEPAVREVVSRSIRTVGIVVPDETRVRHVHTKIEGWVEGLHATFTGQMVEKGQPILSLYSPELLATQEEFLRARETAARFAASPSPEVRKLGEDLVRSARRRLELFDVPASFLAELERTGCSRRAVTLDAPVTGFVTAKEIFEGQKVEPGMELFTVTDLSRVWIEAEIYEYEAPLVRTGQEAVLTLSYEPGVALRGKVAYVFPYLTPETRTLKVRFEFPNADLRLKPAMFADVSLAVEEAEGVVIPDSALIDSGVRKVAFVETAPGTFEPREVKVGVRGGGKAQVLAGVGEGEKVVVKANFLLDSESRLRAALTKMTAVPGGHTGH